MQRFSTPPQIPIASPWICNEAIDGPTLESELGAHNTGNTDLVPTNSHLWINPQFLARSCTFALPADLIYHYAYCLDLRIELPKSMKSRDPLHSNPQCNRSDLDLKISNNPEIAAPRKDGEAQVYSKISNKAAM